MMFLAIQVEIFNNNWNISQVGREKINKTPKPWMQYRRQFNYKDPKKRQKNSQQLHEESF